MDRPDHMIGFLPYRRFFVRKLMSMQDEILSSKAKLTANGPS